jgi:hypothetical protein
MRYRSISIDIPEMPPLIKYLLKQESQAYVIRPTFTVYLLVYHPNYYTITDEDAVLLSR